MHKLVFILVSVILSNTIAAQIIVKPRGCYAGTNGTHPAVLAHPDARGVLVTDKWANIEAIPGVYDFTALDAKINTVKAAGLKYALAIPAGAFGSPDWLIDSLNVSHHTFQYQNQTWRLPLWWDSLCNQKLTDLITQIGNQYASDSMLSHVYVSQMTVNGVEGHLNGVDMSAFAADGFTAQKWITSAKSTTNVFANAFPDKPIVFEVHEIDSDTIVPATIMNDLHSDPNLCGRVGLGMWWISGKETYQSDLIDFISHFQGDKYAQIIGRSDQTERFKDSLYSTVFSQAKLLNIRYMEPWPYEFQNNTYDSLIHDFNLWADSNFSSQDTCNQATASTNIELTNNALIVYPNPTNGTLHFQIDFAYQTIDIEVFNLQGKNVLTTSHQTSVDIRHLPAGNYIIQVNIDEKRINKALIKME